MRRVPIWALLFAVAALFALPGYGVQVRVGGAIDKPMEMTMAYIKANFEEITIPVTLVCAGNRRKEENMIKQGLG